jgi:murein DD-endopeptidase MepM/ murein hydrolase activator NlpD
LRFKVKLRLKTIDLFMNNLFMFNKYFIFIIFLTMITDCAGRQRVVTEPAPGKVAAQEQFTGIYHTVEKGQTLWRIARTYDVDLETLQWVNDVEDVTDIRVGRVLFIPGVQRVLKVVPLKPEQEVPPSRKKIMFAWPLMGRQTSLFGPRGRRHHDGVDIAAPTGTPVRAAAQGRVAYSGAGMKGYGKVVVVKHASDLSTVYAHNSSLLVKMGDNVKRGQVIARVGSSGWATGPHLHFEVRRRGVPENPNEYLPAP